MMPARSLTFLFLLVFAGLAADGRVRAQAPVPADDVDVVTAPVELDGAVLFRLRGASSFPAEQRARLAADRLRAVAADGTIAIESLHTVEADGATRIVAGALPIVTVVEADATLEQIRREDLATSHLNRVRQAIVDYRAARSPAARRRQALNFLVATLLLVVTVGILIVFWRWVERVLSRRLEGRIRSVEIQSFQLMRAERIWSAVRSGLHALRALLFLAVALIYVGYVLAQFPSSRGMSQNLVVFALGPLQVMAQGFVRQVPSLVFLTVLFFVVRLALRLVRVFFEAVGQGTIALGKFEDYWAEPTYKIVRFAVVAFALVIAYPYIPGSGTAAFQGVSLFLGVLLSIGSSSAISNIIAGYMVTYRRALRVGDRVKIGSSMGDVVEIRLQATYLRSFKNEEIIIPNSQILAGEVINYSTLSKTDGLIFHSEVGIGYETPWRQVEAMLLMAVERTPGFVTQPPPFVVEKALGDFAVTYEVNAFSHNVKSMLQQYAGLHRNILDVFNEYGVQIMTPAYEGDPTEPKVVSRSDWFAQPAKRAPDVPSS